MNPIPFTNQYLALGEAFYKKTRPTPVAAPAWIEFNKALAADMGLSADELSTPDGVNIFAGNVVPKGAEPLAMAYAGHQFGNFVPQLGDGRAILLGDLLAPDGICLDIQLKGSGRTFYSRNGDGRAALGPVLREYLVSEAGPGGGDDRRGGCERAVIAGWNYYARRDQFCTRRYLRVFFCQEGCGVDKEARRSCDRAQLPAAA